MSHTHSPSARTHQYARAPSKVHKLTHNRTYRFTTYFTLPSLLLCFPCSHILFFFPSFFPLQSPEQLLIKTLEMCLTETGRERLRMENSRMEREQIDVRLKVNCMSPTSAQHLETSAGKRPGSTYITHVSSNTRFCAHE